MSVPQFGTKRGIAKHGSFPEKTRWPYAPRFSIVDKRKFLFKRPKDVICSGVHSALPSEKDHFGFQISLLV